MSKIKSFAALVVTGIMAISLFTGCAPKEEEKDTIRLNEVVHSIFYAPQYVALEKGFFAEEGLEVVLSVGQGADKSMTALLSESADIALLGIEAGIYVTNEGKEGHIKPFAQLTQRAGNFIVSRQEEPNFKWENLKGKSIIGGRPGGMPELILEHAIKSNGLVIGEDVEIINNIAFSSTSGAFVGGVGDYTAEFEPVASTLEEQGNGYVVASLGEASGFLPYTVYMTTDTYAKENPELVQKFTNAIYKGQKWVNEHSAQEVAEVCLPYFKESSIELLTKVVERYKAQETWKENPVFDKEGFELIQDIMQDGGELDRRVDFDTLIDNSFAKKAMETVR
jgi:NitT/TauT family transport system substrate-binding protein